MQQTLNHSFANRGFSFIHFALFNLCRIHKLRVSGIHAVVIFEMTFTAYKQPFRCTFLCYILCGLFLGAFR